MRIICDLTTLWLTITSYVKTGEPTPISGHEFIELPRYRQGDRIIEPLKCTRCGVVSKAWY